jgi:class 3 adenylate cyclase/DNA-binding CsgD family transcriptional regulator/tetratricopeptide (TPR) repeat protein
MPEQRTMRSLVSMTASTNDDGLTTVVFVDVEGSTNLLRSRGDDAGTVAIRRSLDAARDRAEPYGGRVVKSLGDGLLLTFPSPRRAVAFALASQRALQGSVPRVRIGINTGEVVDARADPLGGAVNAASRITDRADGGEVLVSDVVRQLVGRVPEIRFVDRGRHRLRGFTERWHLWAVEDGSDVGPGPTTVGRAGELRHIAELVSSTVAGSGRVLVLEGEAGIGKTHLADVARTSARRADMVVIDVVADEIVRRPGALVYALRDAARPRDPARARLDELLGSSAEQDQPREDLRYAVMEASIDVVGAVSRNRPVLLVAEDLHWADDLSLMVLGGLVRGAATSSVAVLATTRPTPRAALLDRLLERVTSDGGRRLALSSLDDVDVHALATVLTGAAPGPQLRQRLHAASGNPLFVTELLRSFDDDDLLSIHGGIADVTDDAVPRDLHGTLARRLSWLPRDTNEMLRLASLFGTSFTLRELAALTGRSVVDVAGSLREASAAGLVVGEGDRLAFRHDLIREAVHADLLPAEQRDLHRAAALALARIGAPPSQVAQQFALGAEPGDLEAVEWLERAATESTSVSPTTAIELLLDAVRLAPTGWPGLQALRARLVEPLAWCGRFDEATAIVDTILAAPIDDDVEFAALRGLSSILGNRGDTSGAIAMLHRAADAPGAPADEARRLRCVAAQLSAISGTIDLDEARRTMEATLAHADANDEPTTRCLAHQTLGVLASITGHADDARRHFEQAVALFDSGQVTVASYLIPDTFSAVALIELDRIDEALVATDVARRRAEQRGTVALLPMAYTSAAGAHLFAGRYDDALAEIEAAHAVIDDTGTVNFVLYCHAIAAAVALRRGDLDEASAQLTRGAERLATHGVLFGADWLLSTQADVLDALGDPHGALTLAELAWSQTAAIRYFYGSRPRSIALARMAARQGRSDLSGAVAAALAEGSRRSSARSAVAAAAHGPARCDGDPDLLLTAVDAYRATPLRPEAARCEEDAAVALLASGRVADAVSALESAAAFHASVGALGDLARVDALLASAGADRPVERASRPTFGWESLTPMELRVSGLVALGHTNREIGELSGVSPRTVETHVSHVFTKLGLTSRSQLAAEVARRSAAS